MIEPLLESELRTAAEAGLVLFEDRLILSAQGPVDEATLGAIAARLVGPLPDSLIALWRTTLGGRLDYDLRCDFGSHSASMAFSELFYPSADGGTDLWRWIEHELELAAESAENDDRPWSGLLDVVPIGGYLYLERFYVEVLGGEGYGTVWAWRDVPAAF